VRLLGRFWLAQTDLANAGEALGSFLFIFATRRHMKKDVKDEYRNVSRSDFLATGITSNEMKAGKRFQSL
jgi:hypothetical protein